MDKQKMIRDNFKRVQEAAWQATEEAGRKREDVRLVTVTKGHPVDEIEAVIAAGAKDLAENYPERALPKIEAIGPQPEVHWHMIGHIQSRKAKLVVGNYDLIHSVDSQKLAGKLDRLAGEAGAKLNVLLEVNVSGEQSKFGWDGSNETLWLALSEALAPVIQYTNLQVKGLMTMAPYGSDPEEARPVFAKLRRFNELLGSQYPELNLEHLSMGMSSDYQAAIKEGATLVRIGTAIMGSRY